MHQSPHEPGVRAISGEKRLSWPSSAGLDCDPPAVELLHSDPGLETTLLAYSNLKYRDAFWPRRRYEDLCDRIALRSFLPPTGDRLIEVGAGFGRFADEYAGYREVVLLDASEALLQAARARFGGDPRFTTIAGDAYSAPIPGRQLRRRGLHSGPASLRGPPYGDPRAPPGRATRRRARAGVRQLEAGEPGVQRSAPTSFIHSPRDLDMWVRAAGFKTHERRSVGLFRLPILTSHVAPGFLVTLERLQQVALAPITAGPSIFIKAVRRPGSPVVNLDRVPGGED